MNNRYEDPPPTDRAELAEALDGGAVDLINHRLISLTLRGEDPAWLTIMSLELLHHPSTEVRRAAVTSLGHIARIHGAIDATVIPHLRRLADDPELSGAVSDALDDISTFARD